MTELCTRFNNITTSNLLLFQVEVEHISGEILNMLKDQANKKSIVKLNERPGLERITYMTNEIRLRRGSEYFFKEMREKALHQKDAKVHFILDYMLKMSPITPLYQGQKNIPMMLDNRNKEQFKNIKENLVSEKLSL